MQKSLKNLYLKVKIFQIGQRIFDLGLKIVHVKEVWIGVNIAPNLKTIFWNIKLQYSLAFSKFLGNLNRQSEVTVPFEKRQNKYIIQENFKFLRHLVLPYRY